MLRFITNLLFLHLMTVTAWGQMDTTIKNSINLSVGYTYRWEPLVPINGWANDNSRFTDPYQNSRGSAINLGVEYKFKKLNISLCYRIDIRYDHIYYSWTDRIITSSVENNNGLIVDNYLSLLKYYKSKRMKYLKPMRKSSYVGLGLGLMNTGRKYTYSLNNDNTTYNFNMMYPSINLLFGIPIYKFYIEPSVNFTPRGLYPFKKSPTQIIPLVRVYYSFK